MSLTFDQWIVIIGTVISALSLSLFFSKAKGKTALQLLLTIAFAVASQAALNTINASSVPGLIVVQGFLIFVAAVTATVMLAITGGWIFSLIGVIAIIIVVSYFIGTLSPESQELLRTTWERGSGWWTDRAGQVGN